jgi:hypothetical protein
LLFETDINICCFTQTESDADRLKNLLADVPEGNGKKIRTIGRLPKINVHMTRAAVTLPGAKDQPR